MKAGQLDEAEQLYELARKDDPYHTKWIAGLARVHLRQKNNAKFLADLAMIAANDADDISVRKALAERHLSGGKPAEAEKWAEECLHIDVYDASAHVLLADALSAGNKYLPAVDEYKVALELKPKTSQRPQGQAGEGPVRPGPAERRHRDARRGPQGRSRASGGEGAEGGDRRGEGEVIRIRRQ